MSRYEHTQITPQTSCEDVRPVLSEYADETLEARARQMVADHLRICAHCDRETRQIQQMLAILHKLPAREPSLDIWRELEPKVAEARAEANLGLAARFRLQVGRFLSNVAYGAILFTQALAINTTNRMQKYLLHDGFGTAQEAAR